MCVRVGDRCCALLCGAAQGVSSFTRRQNLSAITDGIENTDESRYLAWCDDYDSYSGSLERPQNVRGNRPCKVSVDLGQAQNVDEIYFSIGLGDADAPYYVSCLHQAEKDPNLPEAAARARAHPCMMHTSVAHRRCAHTTGGGERRCTVDTTHADAPLPMPVATGP